MCLYFGTDYFNLESRDVHYRIIFRCYNRKTGKSNINRLFIFHFCPSSNLFRLPPLGPLMVITQKVTSLAFNLHDGISEKGDAELTKNQKAFAVYKHPSALEYFSYALAFPALMAGPVVFYKDYIDFIHGNNLMIQKPASVSQFFN